MKKYRQVLAGLLSMSLIINTMAAGTAIPSMAAENTDQIDVYQESEVDAENPSEPTGAEEYASDDNAEITVDDVVVEPSEPAPSAPETDPPVTEAPVTEAPVTEAPATEAPVTEPSVPDTEAPVTEAPSTENPQTETSEPDDPGTDETDIIPPETELEKETDHETERESETETETETEEISTQTAVTFDGTLKLDYFDYDQTTNTVKIANGKQLILLSNLDAEILENLNIFVTQSGGDLDITGTATIADADLPNLQKAANGIVVDDPTAEEETTEETSVTGSEQTTAENSEAVLLEENEIAVNRTKSSADEIILDEKQSETAETGHLSEPSAESSDGFIIAIEEEGSKAPEGTEEDGTGRMAPLTQEQLDAAMNAEYSYKSIGDKDHPFQGTITSERSVKTDRTLFEVLSSAAQLKTDANTVLSVIWAGKDAGVCMLANTYLFTGANEESVKFPVQISTAAKDESVMGTLLGTVDTKTDSTPGILTIEDQVDYQNASAVKAEYGESGNAGLICNVLESGTIRLNGYQFPTGTYTVNAAAAYDASESKRSEAGNAGGAVGVMKSGTVLEIAAETNLHENAEITSANGNAGGLVGLMEKNAVIRMAGDAGKITVTSPKITGGAAAGGVAGYAENIAMEGSDSTLTVKTPTVKGSTENANAGGFIGYYKVSPEEEPTENSLPSCLNLESPTVATSGQPTNENGGNSGGYFGLLELSGDVTYVFGADDTAAKKEFSATHEEDAQKGNSYGGLAGKVISDTIKSTVSVQNMKITSSYKNEVIYHGGLIGELGTNNNENGKTYLNVSNVDITVNNPYADLDKVSFGGVVGCLAKGSILQTENQVKISTGTLGSDPQIWEGGGVVGCAEAKSVIELSGETDLSGVQYVGNRKTVGWLVGYQDGALIYAKGDGNGQGWKYTRGAAKKQFDNSVKNCLNDIANYGQVIRLQAGQSESKLSSDLISIDEKDHTVNLKKPLQWSGDNINLGSEDEFALLSIAWNSRGNFSADKNTNWTNFTNKNITLSSGIDLTGTGITGLSRDTNQSDDDTYTGTFDGNGKTIKLAVGESFGFNADGTKAEDSKEGSGKVYATDTYHAALGLFARTNKSTVKNLILDGTINFSNRAASITAGGIAAVTLGKTTIQSVTAKEEIKAYCPETQALSVGGLYGCESGGELEIKDDTEVSTTITLENGNQDGSYVYAGGVIGQITSDTYKIAVNGLKVCDGSITTDASTYAYVGGLTGIIKPRDGGDSATENRWLEIRSLTFDGFTITAPKATQVCGGLFGSIMSNVGVYFMGADDTTDGADTGIKLTVQNSGIDAPKAAGVGGLAYRSSGIWEIRKNGIKIDSLMINSGGDVGLLVCRGEKGNAVILGVNNPMGAMYLLTTDWDTSYQLSQNSATVTYNTSKGVFDEFVAHTAADANKIVDMGKNGVISIATKNRAGVDKNGSCTTYRNRTLYKTSNPCSRYYYDLDQHLITASSNRETEKNNTWLDTPEELLLWSVYMYASRNIRQLIVTKKNGKEIKYNVPDCQSEKNNDTPVGPTNGWKIGSIDTKKPVQLDMKGYSYYPISITNSSINMQNATLTFWNEEIEDQEKENKSTQGSRLNHTQHYAMHCGLFWTYQAPSATLTVINITFAGSIGKVDSNASGALAANTATGYLSGTTPMTVTINMSGVILDNLKVNGYTSDEYAPLLFNRFGNSGCITLNVSGDKDGNGIKACHYKEGEPVASSLIGTVGDKGAQQIKLSFMNVALPDKKANGTEGIFSHATLLESFAHDGSSSVATYNFYKGEEWNGTAYDHGVTYGREITETSEYRDLQLWYYDEENYGTKENRVHDDSVTDPEQFSSTNYLPYVCVPYNEQNRTHEIKVNQRVADIINGCGTYGHPYEIHSEKEMTILSEYLSTGKARTDWRVTITGNPEEYCTETARKDVTYQYNGSSWDQVAKEAGKDEWKKVSGAAQLKDTVMRQYLLNAYYDLQGSENNGAYTLKLNNFGGFGTAFDPFRGVLTSTVNATVVLSGENTCNGLIPYSYGSVVKNLTISYLKSDSGAGKTLSYANTKRYYQDSCFGGVIGCVLGGDNIIDHVTVTMESGWLKLSGDRTHLIQVGGYVGSVSGGGVIFRNMTDADISGTDSIVGGDSSYLYVNPYVGRVLDGFAFYEAGTGIAPLENTDKNYRINLLDTEAASCVTSAGTTVTVNNAQGLLLLSAMVNSGAASGGISNAYSNTQNTENTKVGTVSYQFAGKYGKVRKASYSHIGKGSSDDDVKLAQADDQMVPGDTSLPYLIWKYGNQSTDLFGICGDSGITINLSQNGSYDMSGYGKGYQGIGARYVSNAILSGKQPNPKGIIPELTGFNGNGSTVTVNMQVKEYNNDDFHAASVGGVFNLLRTGTSGSTVKALTVSGSRDTGVSLEYCSASGGASGAVSWKVAVGGFAGGISGISAESRIQSQVKFQSVKLKDLTVNGPVNAGGLLGTSVKTEQLGKAGEGTIAYLLSGASECSAGITIENSEYDTITVTAPNAAGGFVGSISNTQSSLLSTAGTEDLIIGKKSKIGNADNTTTYAGGVFGYMESDVTVNAPESGTASYVNAVIEDTSVAAKSYAGGLIGRIDGKAYVINKVIFRKNTGTAKVSAANTADCYTGGIAGMAGGTGENCRIQNCQVIQAEIGTDSEKSENAGGIAGAFQTVPVTVEKSTVEKSNITGGKAGGIAGTAAIAMTIRDCTVKGTEDGEKASVTGSQAAGGMIGFSSNGKNDISMERCSVRDMEMASSAWGCGGLLGDVDWNSMLGTWYVFDSVVEDSTVSGKTQDAPAGGLAGDLRGNLVASNLLLSGVQMKGTQENQVGMVLGMADSRTGKIDVAGISIQKTEASYGDSETKVTQLYGVIKDSTTEETRKSMQENSYFAFADYSGTAAGRLVGSGADLLVDSTTTDVRPPYVVTSPKSSLSVKESNKATAEAKYLYGDGASWKDGAGFTVKAEEILKSRKTAADGHYSYCNIPASGEHAVPEDFDFTNVISTYNANQTDKAGTDFPVLQITGGDTEKVEQYLDILTNGGFSAANDRNTPEDVHVTAKAEVYEYQKGTFVKNEKASPAFKVSVDGSKKIRFATTADHDNDKGRFTLLTVTFTEKDAEEKKHHYKVLVPLLVRRMLEVDFVATLTYGTHFRSTDYADLKNHVLESYGNPVTGYLTYTYNSAEGEYVDYGWQSYIDAGGDVTSPFEKILWFYQNSTPLVKGTQLTLIDCQDENRTSYYYEVAESKGGDTKICLNDFKASDGKTTFGEKSESIGELLQVKAMKDAGGTFIEVDKDGKPLTGAGTGEKFPAATVQTEGHYYRLAVSGEDDQERFKITVNEDAFQKNGKSTVEENYYLVITLPETSTGAANGDLRAELGESLKHNVHYLLRGSKEKDSHNNTASTYRIFSGYTQELGETLGNNLAIKALNSADSKVHISVRDKVKFEPGQFYQTGDQLYLQFTGNLQITNEKGTSTVTQAEQFPDGTTGQVSFYVYTVSGTDTTYYSYSDGTWKPVSGKERAFQPFTWTSRGGNLELVLSTDGTAANAVSLQQIRDTYAKSNNEFYVEAQLDAAIPANRLSVIPETQPDSSGNLSAYAKLSYTSQLAVEKNSLSYSSMRAVLDANNTKVKYYRDQPVGAVLTYEAYETSQLGINLLDLDQSSKTHALINTTATYNLDAMKNVEDTLKRSIGIRFTLSLEPKNTDGATEDYAEELKNSGEYMDVKAQVSASNTGAYTKIENSGNTWSWTIPKETYYEEQPGGSTASPLLKSDVFDGNSVITQQIQLLVRTDNVEEKGHLYSNYKVTLKAEVLEAGGTAGTETAVSGTSASDYIIYTLAKINTQFVDNTANSGS